MNKKLIIHIRRFYAAKQCVYRQFKIGGMAYVWWFQNLYLPSQ